MQDAKSKNQNNLLKKFKIPAGNKSLQSRQNLKLGKLLNHLSALCILGSVFCLLSLVFLFPGCAKKFTIPPLVENNPAAGYPNITSITSIPQDRVAADPIPTSPGETITIIVCGYDPDSYLDAKTAFTYKMYNPANVDVSSSTFGPPTYSNDNCLTGFQVNWTAPATLGNYTFDVTITDTSGYYTRLTKLAKVENIYAKN